LKEDLKHFILKSAKVKLIYTKQSEP